MAPVKKKANPQRIESKHNIFTTSHLKKLIFDPHYVTPTCIVLFIFEIVLNIFIIERVNYTEIDWKAYMQEVEGFINGTWDYKELKGDTGPLVYPAGFVYIYTIFYFVTSRGSNVYLAQYVFLTLYLVQSLLTYQILRKTAKIPPYALVVATLTSYRIHSIFVLRLFNDPIAVLLFYVSLNLFITNRWRLGSLFFSLAVSVKMNILLYAPCLLIAYLTNLSVPETISNLMICVCVQLLLGAPFLYSNPYSYVRASFDLGRIFEHTWTVNYRFLPREIFESRTLHVSLLVLHVLALLLFAPILRRYFGSYAKLKPWMEQVRQQLKQENEKLSKEERAFLDKFEEQLNRNRPTAAEGKRKFEEKLSKVTQLFVLPFFATNLIGIVFARSLHYQFYSWYFHSLLYLGFSTGFRKPLVFLLLAVIEYCWNVYPSTELSSALLHVCHFTLLYGVYRTMKM